MTIAECVRDLYAMFYYIESDQLIAKRVICLTQENNLPVRGWIIDGCLRAAETFENFISYTDEPDPDIEDHRERIDKWKESQSL